MSSESSKIQQQLSDVFGTYRAEWLQDQVFELFTEPRYFPELTTRQSCVLIGGRGTGKTTVLRGLSYQGQERLAARRNDEGCNQSSFIGVYHRINTNHIAAFDGGGIATESWQRIFAHYFNLLLCQLLFEFLVWHSDRNESQLDLDRRKLKRVCRSLHVEYDDDPTELLNRIIDSILEFESHINNINDNASVPLSIQQRPVELLCDTILSATPFAGKHIFFLLDEYENLLPYQQKVVNTFIKHTSGNHFFKIGVKELGWSCRSTLQPNEQLISPADYALIPISDRMSDEAFLSFATDVCENRLAQVEIDGKPIRIKLRKSLPAISCEDEAELLGVRNRISGVVDKYRPEIDDRHVDLLESMTPLEQFFFDGWIGSHNESAAELLDNILSSPRKWKERFDNNKYACLFAVRQNKRGIDKYYCGLEVYSQLACGNIRYMLELVDHSFLRHIREENDPLEPISSANQTKATQHVGSMNLAELEGLSVSGARLTKMLLSLGRVFQQLAADPFGHAPEVNQFHFINRTDDVEALLSNAVMHLALVRIPGTKLGSESNVIEFDYTIHPIFAPLFEFSPRRKRKMEISSDDLVELIEHPKSGIADLLKRHNRSCSVPAPRQLALFSQFYDSDD